ncbi:MBL fold metallo-hydrolase [Psychromonas sp. MME2]|uniref:MBL fold metallo-hydrolase n=1 Tax=unclassified Psychromonas TaxID=2614957 RepID=UPI00339CAB59
MSKADIRLTILADNIAQSGFIAEHGFALLIESNKQRFLFDTGQGEALFENANRLNIVLTDLDGIILSHGHFDHGGNIKKLLHDNPNTTLYLHPDCLQIRYSIHPNKAVRVISLTEETLAAIEQFPAEQKVFNKSITQITEQLFISGEIPRIHNENGKKTPFYLDPFKQTLDKLLDDQSLWIETTTEVIVISGCCHAGVINTLTHIQQNNHQKKTTTLLGGLHLHNADKNKLDNTINYLHETNISKLYLAHCTGVESSQYLKSQFNGTVKSCYAGLTLSIQ